MNLSAGSGPVPLNYHCMSELLAGLNQLCQTVEKMEVLGLQVCPLQKGQKRRLQGALD